MRARNAFFWKTFLYGAAIHFGLLRLFVHWGYRPPANRSVVDNPITNILVALLGGLFVGWLGGRLDRRARRDACTGRIILRGAGYGVAATELTIEASCIAASLALAVHGAATWGFRSLPGGVLLSFIEIQTYAMGVVIQSVPFSFAYGLAGGLWLWRTRGS